MGGASCANHNISLHKPRTKLFIYKLDGGVDFYVNEIRVEIDSLQWRGKLTVGFQKKLSQYQ